MGRLGVVLAMLALAGSTLGGARVVVTGDSITCGYSADLAGLLDPATYPVLAVCNGGCSMARYLGWEIDPYTGLYRDFAGEVLALDPDIVVFMLGTNDAFVMRNDPTWLTEVYAPGMEELAARFATRVSGRGRHPALIILTPLPIVCCADVETNAAAIRAYLREQFPASWPQYLLDAAADLVQVPEWTSWYGPDGEHPNAAGLAWLAAEVAAKVRLVGSRGDMNGDGHVDNQDLDGFALALLAPEAYQAQYPCGNVLWADMNGDGAVNSQDIDGLIVLLKGPAKLGDVNCDGAVNAQDIDPFILALFNAPGYVAQYPNCDVGNADFNGDGWINAQDLDGMILALFGPG